MANLQMKGTEKEVRKVKQLFYLLRSKGVCNFEHCEEVHPKKSEHSELTISSIQLKGEMHKFEDEDVNFVSRALVGVYND